MQLVRTGGRLYVSAYSGDLRCINTSNYSILFTSGINGKWGVTINSAGTRLYVSTNTSGAAGCVVLDALTGGRIAQFNTSSSSNYGLLVNPDDTRLYINSHPATFAIDAQSYQRYPETVYGHADGSMAYSQNSVMGSRLYIPSNEGKKIIITNADRLTNARELVGISGLHSIAIDPTTHVAYCTQGPVHTVTMIDTLTEEVVGQMNGFSFPSGITILPNGVIYVANYGNNTVSVVST